MFGMDDAPRGRRFPMSGCVPGVAAQSGEVQQGEYSSSLLGYSEGEKAVCPQQLHVISMPIMGFGDRTIAVLQAAKRVESPKFTQEDQYILEVRLVQSTAWSCARALVTMCHAVLGAFSPC